MEIGTKSQNKKQRGANWTLDEEMALVDCMVKHYSNLFGPFSNKLTNNDKGLIWTEICESINAVGGSQRQLQSIQAKWTDMKSRTKVKVSNLIREQSKTGGGELEIKSFDVIEEKIAGIVKQWELKVSKLIGVVGILGIPGGIDTSQPSASRAIDILPTKKNSLMQMEYSNTTDSERTPNELYSDANISSSVKNSNFVDGSNTQTETPTYKFKKKRRAEPADDEDNSTKMVKIQLEILETTKRIADSLERLASAVEKHTSTSHDRNHGNRDENLDLD